MASLSSTARLARASARHPWRTVVTWVVLLVVAVGVQGAVSLNTTTDALGSSALHIAAKHGAYDVLDIILDQEGVEIDGREFHIDPHTFTRDRIRQNELVLDGWLVLRYSVARALAHTDEVADEILAVVRKRRKSRA